LLRGARIVRSLRAGPGDGRQSRRGHRAPVRYLHRAVPARL